MRAKKLENILEECIDAGVEGRRTVEESLALYPDYAGELEPLLRTALSLNNRFQAYTPPIATRQRGLHRFLAAAADRRNLREIEAHSFKRRGWLAGFFHNPALAGVGVAAAVVVVTVAVAGGAILSSGGGDGPSDPAVVQPQSPTLSSLNAQVTALQTRRQNGEQITASDPEIVQINYLLQQLKSEVDTIDEPDSTTTQTIQDVYVTLNDVAEDNPELNDDPGVQESLDSTRGIAGVLNIDLPEPTASATPTIAPTATPGTGTVTATPVATTPTQGATPVPTVAPTPTAGPTQAASPTETADARGLDGLSN